MGNTPQRALTLDGTHDPTECKRIKQDSTLTSVTNVIVIFIKYSQFSLTKATPVHQKETNYTVYSKQKENVTNDPIRFLAHKLTWKWNPPEKRIFVRHGEKINIFN